MTILVLTRTAQQHGRFGPFLREICSTEGLDVEVINLDALGPDELQTQLATAEVIITAHASLWLTEIELIMDRVREGTGLVAVRPPRPLLRALGLKPLDRQAPAGYLHRTTEAAGGYGLPADAVQLPVPTDRVAFDPGSTEVIAEAFDQRDAVDGGAPAVLRTQVGKGKVIVSTYDLAAAVVRLRHGDPDRIGARSYGAVPYRQMDLIVDAVDPACWHHPQADVHGQLLAAAITEVSPTPVARWWYYPDAATTTVIIQDSDDDWSTREQFDQLLASADEFDFDLTIYLMLGDRPTVLEPADIARLRARGHSFGIHHDAVGTNWEEGDDQELTLPGIVAKDLATFAELYGGTPKANRNHCLVWAGWADLARVYAEHGVRMEFNAQGTNEAWTGYLFGSARPMRHIDTDGTIIDVFQQPTQVYDDATLVATLGEGAAEEAARAITHLEHCRTETFQPLSMQSHAVSFATYSATFFRTIWAHAHDTGIDIWSAEQWAAETDARDRSTIRTEQDGIHVVAYGTQGPRTLMIPSTRRTLVRVDGRLVDPFLRRVHGSDFAFVTLVATPEGVAHSIQIVQSSAD